MRDNKALIDHLSKVGPGPESATTRAIAIGRTLPSGNRTLSGIIELRDEIIKSDLKLKEERESNGLVK